MSDSNFPKCQCLILKKNKDLYYDAVKSKDLTLVSTKNEDYVEIAQLICNTCSRKWNFTRDDSFHAPIIEWKEVK